jgi:hypothetical protein
MTSTLPFHRTLRYPPQHSLAGMALQALYVDKHGRAHYPMMGGAPDAGDGSGGDGGGAGSGAGAGDGGGSGAGGDGSGAGSGGNGDDNDLGFPKNTRIADMKPEEQAAYWRHQARKHEGNFKGLVGDRSVDDVKKDLEEYGRIRQEQLTPSEKAIQEAEQRGREAATTESSQKAAKAILRAGLEARELSDEDVAEIVDSIDVRRFIKDGDIDTSGLASFAQRFTPAGTATQQDQQQRRRQWAGGTRREGEPERGAAGRAMAEKRFGSKSN